MEWLVVAIIGVVYVIVSKLQLITIKFKDKPQDPPQIKEPEVNRKKLDD